MVKKNLVLSFDQFFEGIEVFFKGLHTHFGGAVSSECFFAGKFFFNMDESFFLKSRGVAGQIAVGNLKQIF